MRKNRKEMTAKRAIAHLVIYITAKLALMALVRHAIRRSLEQRAKSGQLSPETMHALAAIGRQRQEQEVSV